MRKESARPVTGRGVTSSRGVTSARGRSMEGNLPIRNYIKLGVSEIEQKLRKLSGSDLRRIRDFEQGHKSRKTLLKMIEQKLRSA